MCDLELICPHCNETFIVSKKDINCAIFRHAVYRHNMMPINPHEKKEICESLLEQGKIYGCAKPFKILQKNEEYTTEICDYI
jgi:hypothetical protein